MHPPEAYRTCLLACKVRCFSLRGVQGQTVSHLVKVFQLNNFAESCFFSFRFEINRMVTFITLVNTREKLLCPPALQGSLNESYLDLVATTFIHIYRLGKLFYEAWE